MPKCDVLGVELVKAIEHQEESEITNEEWLNGLDTEQKAKFLYEIAFYSNLSNKWMNYAIIENIPTEDSIAMWLKSEHKE